MPALDNPKHELFAQNTAKHNGNRTQAYKDTYKANPAHAHHNAVAIYKKPEVKLRIGELLDQAGMSIKELNTKLYRLTNAKKPFVYGKELMYVNDNSTQVDSIKTGYRLHGLLGNDKLIAAIQNNQANFILEKPEDIATLRSTVNDLKSLCTKSLEPHAVGNNIVDIEPVGDDEWWGWGCELGLGIWKRG